MVFRVSFVLIAFGCIAIQCSPAFRGSESFVVDLSSEEVDADEPITSATTIALANSNNSTATETSEETETPDPAELVNAALGLLNTPVNKMVGSNPLRRLLRLLGPSREDMIATLQMARSLQDAVPTTEASKAGPARRDNLDVKSIDLIPTELPAVVDEIFGFKENDDQLFAPTQKPLFPLITADQDSDLGKVLKSNKISFKL